jgi:probable F420-dependent oxidoreductase
MRLKSPSLGILLPTRGILLRGQTVAALSSLLDLAERVEEGGLDSVWVGDGLLSKPRLEPLSTLAAVAMRTSRIRLGTAVLIAPMRQPVQLAQMAATVDVLSSGRLTLGLGVGGAFTESQEREWRAVGVSPKERGTRMTELLQICRLLWTQDDVTFSGPHFKLANATMVPKPARADGIPVLLACHYGTGSEAQWRRAAHYADGVISISDSPNQYTKVLEKVRKHAIGTGRDPNAIRTAFYMTVNLNESRHAAAREADAFIQLYYGTNIWMDRWGPFGPPADLVRRILEYHQAGAQEIIVRFASLDVVTQFRVFLNEVVPAVRMGILSS